MHNIARGISQVKHLYLQNHKVFCLARAFLCAQDWDRELVGSACQQGSHLLHWLQECTASQTESSLLEGWRAGLEPVLQSGILSCCNPLLEVYKDTTFVFPPPTILSLKRFFWQCPLLWISIVADCQSQRCFHVYIIVVSMVNLVCFNASWSTVQFTISTWDIRQKQLAGREKFHAHFGGFGHSSCTAMLVITGCLTFMSSADLNYTPSTGYPSKGDKFPPLEVLLPISLRHTHLVYAHCMKEESNKCYDLCSIVSVSHSASHHGRDINYYIIYWNVNSGSHTFAIYSLAYQLWMHIYEVS